MTEKWNEITIKTEYDNWNRLESFLYRNEIFSFELIDPRIPEDNDGWDFIDENIFKDEFPGITVKFYFDENDKSFDIERFIFEIKENKLGIVEEKLIDDRDWENNWKDFYKVQDIGKTLAIKPTWEEYENKENRHIITLDPGMAFGTGNHETTKMCLEKIEKYVKKDDRCLDIGTGSGILSIGLKLLGAGEVVGTDLEDKVIDIARENAKMNNVSIDFHKSNLFSDVSGEYDLIVSNIVAEVIVKMIEGDLKKYLKKDGYFISSGIIKEKSEFVENSLLKNGFEIAEKEEENDWVSIVARYLDV